MGDIINSKFDCELVISFRKKFFAGDLPPRIEDILLGHLLDCKGCREVYSNYAKSIGINQFNVQRYAIKFYKKNRPNNTSNVKSWLIKLRDEKKEEALSHKWTQAAKEFDISELMNMKAFADLSNEYDSPTHEDYSDFYKYLAIKFGQKIDHLELCLFKECDNNNNSNKRNKEPSKQTGESAK